MKIIEKITESVFFKTLIEKINDLIGNSNECKIALDSYNEQLGNLADATPLPANSVSDMTDSTKLYVNISDGYIYRHDGSAFVSTGILYQAAQIEYAQQTGDSEDVAMSQKATTEQLNRDRKTTYNLFDKYNPDIHPFYIRNSDKLITQQSYARAVVIKRTSVIGEIVLFNCFKSASELGVKDMALYMCSEYPQVGGHALAYDKSYCELAYGRGKPNVTADCEYLVLQFTWDTTTTTTTTDELFAQLIENLIIVCGLEVNNYDDYPYTERYILKVEKENLSDELKEDMYNSLPSINYIETKTVYLGDNVLGSASLGDGWTVSNGIYSHSAGYTSDLTFATSVENGSMYILEFDTSYTSDEFIRVGIGDKYRVLCYQGKSHITVPLMASGNGILYITPIKDTYVGDISNIILRKIQENGTECTLELYSTLTKNHTQNYGFWNNFIGYHTAENAVGTTRSIAIGYYTLNALQGGHRNIGIGTFAMSQLIGGEENVSIGADNMIYVQKADGCISIGMGAMSKGTELFENIAIGKCTLVGANDSTSKKNVAIGGSAGYKCVGQGNTMLGFQAGYHVQGGIQNILIGNCAYGASIGNFNTIVGANANYNDGISYSVAIGHNARATKSNQAVLGSDSITETLLKGNLIVRGTDGVYRQIIFNPDGTCSWSALDT